jgi:hypothetical protein
MSDQKRTFRDAVGMSETGQNPTSSGASGPFPDPNQDGGPVMVAQYARRVMIGETHAVRTHSAIRGPAQRENQ